MRAENKSFSNGVQVVWDATSLDLAQTCPRKYYYRMIASIVPQRTSVHLIFGGIYAKALETFYGFRAEGWPIDEALRHIVRLALQMSWDYERNQPLEFLDGGGKTREGLIRTIIWYVDEFGNEDEHAIKTHHLSDGKAAVELSVMMELSDDILYAGHLDRVVDFGGHLYWMDQKTTGASIGSYYFSNFELSNQFLGYTLLGQTVLKSPIKGGIIDAAQIAVGFSRFQRGFFSATADRLDEWRDNTLWTIREMQQLTEEDRWPMRLTSCGNYGGCPYRTLCSRTPGVRANFIQGDYKSVAPWDPAVPR